MGALRLTVAEARRQGLLPAAPTRQKPAAVAVRAYAVCAPGARCPVCQQWLAANQLSLPLLARVTLNPFFTLEGSPNSRGTEEAR